MKYEKSDRAVGVGPHPMPWPESSRYDKDLLAHGDARNVEDAYRYWTIEAIKADMKSRAVELEIAIENWQHDSNIGTIVRTANAFNVSKIHIIGKRHWNKRGAMVTDKYMDIMQHASLIEFIQAINGRDLIAIDNIDGAIELDKAILPSNAVLIFGGEGPGVSDEMLKYCHSKVAIPQYGSTRSLNIGVAAGIVMYQWLQQNIVVK